jgi:hypothetical protein
MVSEWIEHLKQTRRRQGVVFANGSGTPSREEPQLVLAIACDRVVEVFDERECARASFIDTARITSLYTEQPSEHWVDDERGRLAFRSVGGRFHMGP